MEKGNDIKHAQMALLFQQGEEQGLAFFYREFLPALSLYAHRWLEDRSVAEEIASQALAKTWKMHWKLDSYAAIRAYLYKIVQRDSTAYLRKEKKRTSVHEESQPLATETDTPFDHLVRTEVYHIVHSALKNLSPANRQVITMHYLEGKTTGQIARELKVHPSTVKTQKARGLQALRKVILRPIIFLLYLFA